LNSYKPFNDVWKFYGDFVNPAFKSIWPTMTISRVCVYKKEFQLLQKVLKAHSTYYATVSDCIVTHTEVYE